MMTHDVSHIEILSVDLLDQHRPLVEKLKRVAKALNLELGWHYLLDLTWIITHLQPGLGKTAPAGPALTGRDIMDAGAGVGLMQWYLAQEGARVLSVDRLDRASLPLRFRTRFNVRGLRPQDLVPSQQVFKDSFWNAARFSSVARDLLVALLSGAPAQRGSGQVIFYHQDLKSLVDIPTASLDAVVAVSALEHNTPVGLEAVVEELMRVLKPGGKLLATLCAHPGEDWWHEPSKGWCYTDDSLRRRFHLPADTPSNYASYDTLFAGLQNCAELRNSLASFYFKSGDNGMPWGKWEPQYQPVGVCKIK